MSDTSVERTYLAEWLKWLVHRGFCLETRVIEAVASPGLAIVSGDVMELGTGVKLVCVTAATGANAIAILCEPVSLADSLADCNRLCIVRGPAVIDSDKLSFSVSDTQKAAALTALAALDIRAVNSALAVWTTAP
jgi:hypothetical protein